MLILKQWCECNVLFRGTMQQVKQISQSNQTIPTKCHVCARKLQDENWLIKKKIPLKQSNFILCALGGDSYNSRHNVGSFIII